MAVKIAKKGKSKINQKVDDETAKGIVILTNYLNFAIFIRMLKTEFNFTDEMFSEVVESYAAYCEEINDGRSGLWEFINDTQRLTKIDVKTFIDDYGWKKGR